MPTTPWLVKQTRNVHPKHMSWVLFPMDGRYRKGFYNIALTQPLDIKEGDEFDRLVFDVQYRGNDVFVEVELMSNDMLQTKALDNWGFALFLGSQYVDLNRKVNIFVNGKKAYSAKPTLRWEYIVESCGLFGDPERLFPAKILLKSS